jgi:Immunity protein 50
VFGAWPSFHDAEVISFSIERELPFKNDFTLARMKVNVWLTVTEYSDEIHYEHVDKNNSLVTFIFHEAIDIELSGFNHQNVIDAIEVQENTDGTNKLLVEIVSCWGFGGSLRCSRIEIESVQSV